MPNSPPHIVLLEDDHFQVSDFSKALAKHIGMIKLEQMSCEVEFLDHYEVKPAVMPDLFVLDLMVGWQSRWVKTLQIHNPNMPKDRAGIRCLQALRKYNTLVPVIICTVVDTNTLDMNPFDQKTTFLHRKEEYDEPLTDLIRKLLASR
jgi:hypothetical protein